MIRILFPRVADNRYPGHRLGLWLFALMLLKIAMGVNVVLNTQHVARTADGIPVDTFAAPAAAAFSFMFAAWGLAQLVLGLLSLVVLLRYRSLVPLMFLALLVEQLGRIGLHGQWTLERAAAPGGAINLGLATVMVLGLALSLWRHRRHAARAPESLPR